MPRPEVVATDSPTRAVIESQQPLIVPDAAAETRWPETIMAIRHQGTESFCVLPLTTAHRRLGVLAFGRRERAAYTAAEVEFMVEVAKLVAMAVENALAFREIAQLKAK